MYIEPFHKFFPKLAADECRAAIVFGDSPYPHELPADEYAFTEAYCADPTCDCRRVMINVVSREQGRVLATISFGFDREGDMAGPFLDPLNPQSPYAEELLDVFENVILQDPSYVERLERHYELVKRAVSQYRRTKMLARRKERKKQKRRLKRQDNRPAANRMPHQCVPLAPCEPEPVSVGIFRAR